MYSAALSRTGSVAIAKCLRLSIVTLLCEIQSTLDRLCFGVIPRTRLKSSPKHLGLFMKQAPGVHFSTPSLGHMLLGVALKPLEYEDQMIHLFDWKLDK